MLIFVWGFDIGLRCVVCFVFVFCVFGLFFVFVVSLIKVFV